MCYDDALYKFTFYLYTYLLAGIVKRIHKVAHTLEKDRQVCTPLIVCPVSAVGSTACYQN